MSLEAVLSDTLEEMGVRAPVAVMRIIGILREEDETAAQLIGEFVEQYRPFARAQAAQLGHVWENLEQAEQGLSVVPHLAHLKVTTSDE